MGYLHIDNLYKNPEILMFKEVYAMEKIHGTSAHIRIRKYVHTNHDQMPIGNYDIIDGKIVGREWTEEIKSRVYENRTEVTFFAGGEKHENFIKLFDADKIIAVANQQFPYPDVEVYIYGEAYGGKCQGMSKTYGKDLKFIVFDVKVGGSWLSVPQAEEVAKNLQLDFVWYNKVTTDIESLDAVRIRFSEQAKRNGCGDDKMQEGIVLRPLIELRKNSGERIIAKYKNDAFIETRTPRVVGDKLKILEDANNIASEWVTEMRLTHVLDKMPGAGMENIPDIIKAMTEDIQREGKEEIVDSVDVRRSIGRATALMFKKRLQSRLKGEV